MTATSMLSRKNQRFFRLRETTVEAIQEIGIGPTMLLFEVFNVVIILLFFYVFFKGIYGVLL